MSHDFLVQMAYCYWNQSIDLLCEEVRMNISVATICLKMKIWKYVFLYKTKDRCTDSYDK